MTDPANLPYRPCAGIMLLNRDGKVFVGKRIDNKEGDWWQMPQGGIDEGEDAETAALRELGEETGIAPDLVELVAVAPDELFYDLPPEMIGKVWKGRWRGQRQRWFLYRFLGEDRDVDIATVITRVTDELPREEDVDRVRARLALGGWPLADPRLG